MKRYLKTVGAFLVALSMTALPTTAQSNGGGGRQSHFSTSQSSSNGHKPRPGSNNNGQGASRPGNSGHSGSHSSHNKGNSNNQRPGNKPGNNQRPGGNNSGNNKPNNNRPDHKPNNKPNNRPNNRPNNGHHQPDYGHQPNVSHGHNNHGGGWRPTPPPPPSGGHNNHHVPFFGHYHRPTPPPAWHPVNYGPSFGTILGVALGTAIDYSVRSLMNQGYNVTGYGNNAVYLTNVPQMNFYWPEAVMYYNNGALCGSSFTYPSTYRDMTRYNNLYVTFCRQYGNPISSVNHGGVISATWFGNGNRYVTLEFNSNYDYYYTTLSFGL